MKYLISVLLYVTAIPTFFVFASIYLLSLWFIPANKLHWLAKIVCHMVSLGCGQWVIVEGEIPRKEDGPYLYLFNHASIIDPFPLGVAISHYLTGVMAKEQFCWPIWGAIMRRYGVISIDRENRSKAISSIKEAEVAINNGVSVIISPEGTRTIDGNIGEFKKGPFHIAQNTGVKIVLIVMSGNFEAKGRGNWLVKPGVITVKFHEVISSDCYKDMNIDEFQRYIQEIMSKMLRDMRK